MKKYLFPFLIALGIFAPTLFAHAARLDTIGFELDSLTSGVEIGSSNAISGGTAGVITTSTVHSGNYAESASTTNKYSETDYEFATGASTTFMRAYVDFTKLPTATDTIMGVGKSGNVNYGGVYINSSGQMGLEYYGALTTTSSVALIATSSVTCANVCGSSVFSTSVSVSNSSPGNTVVVVGLSFVDTITVSSIKIGGQTATEVTGAPKDSGITYADMWYISTSTKSGTFNVTTTMSATPTNGFSEGVASLSGTDPANPIDTQTSASGSNGHSSTTLTTTVNGDYMLMQASDFSGAGTANNVSDTIYTFTQTAGFPGVGGLWGTPVPIAGATSTGYHSGGANSYALLSAAVKGLQKGATYGSSLSSAIATGTWNYVELETTSTVANTHGLIGELNGTQFDTENDGTTGAINTNSFGYWGSFINEPLNGETGSVGVAFDDIAFNDAGGTSTQNTFAGAGNDILYLPAGPGDSNTWSPTSSSAGGTVNNWTLVSTLSLINTAGTTNGVNAKASVVSDLYAVASSSTLPLGATINVVQEGVRIVPPGTPPVASLKVQIEKTSGGTIASGTTISVAGTQNFTNSPGAPNNSTLTLYNDPDGSPWTNSTISTMQMGQRVVATGTHAATVTLNWAYVDYTPGAASSTTSPPPNEVVCFDW